MLPSRKDRFLTALMHYLPHHFLSSLMYKLARSKWPPLKKMLIEEIAGHFKIDLFDAEVPYLSAYPSFNAFFTRALKAGARPICKQPLSVASPVDGKVSQCGAIEHGKLLQAKGQDFSLKALLAGSENLAQEFAEGSFATIYLSPRDYHRIHMPYTGQLRKMIFVPGRLFSVNEATSHLVPNLYARNERVICLFDTEAGPMAVILVGAIFVGSMETVWHGEVRGPSNKPGVWNYEGEKAITLEKGAELGRFNMGSTVVMLFPQGANQWLPALKAGIAVKMGQRVGTLNKLAG